MTDVTATIWPPLDGGGAPYGRAVRNFLATLSDAAGITIAPADPDTAVAPGLVMHLAFPQGVIALFEAAVTNGHPDSAEDFMAFASDRFSTFVEFRRAWLVGRSGPDGMPTLNLSQMRGEPAGQIRPVLRQLAPASNDPDTATIDRIAAVAEPLMALTRPDAFRHYTPQRFALLRQIRLKRETVVRTFEDFMGRPPAENDVLSLQTLISVAELKDRLGGTDEDQARRGLTADEIRTSYQVFLDRTPSQDEIARVRKNHPDLQSLHRTFLHSPEFARLYAQRPGAARTSVIRNEQPIEIKPATAQTAASLQPADAQRIVFLHVPKCGGTTLHHTLSHWFGDDNMHAERFNELYRHSAANLATSLVFSGHYDFYSTTLIPGPKAMISFLRDPADRLVSLYNFHRAHTPTAIKRHNLKLPRWANQHDIDAYFAHPKIRVDPAVNNTMVRYFSNVPQVDDRVLSESLKAVSLEQMLEQAMRNVERFAFVGFMDRYERDLGRLADTLGCTPLAELRKHQVLDDMMQSNPDMHSIEKQRPSTESHDNIEELVRYDRIFYAHARDLFS